MYKVRIENLETGKVEVDEVTNCVIAVTNMPGEGRTHCVAVASAASSAVVKSMLYSVRGLCKRVKKIL